MKKAKGKSGKEMQVVDPRQVAFLAAWADPASDTFSNALQSALKVGYSQEYAENITSLMPNWLSEAIGRDQRAELGLKHLDEILLLPIQTPAMGAFGPILKKVVRVEEVQLKNGKTKKRRVVEKVPVMVNSMSIVKEKTAAAKLVLEATHTDYKKQGGNKFSFTFNAAGAKARYDA